MSDPFILLIVFFSHFAPRQGSLAGLVRSGGSLAGLELLEVPVADLHVAVVLVHALCEVLRGARAVVVVLVLGGRGGGGSSGSRGGFRRAAGEEAADGVADRGADSDTTARELLARRDCD